MNYVYDTKFPYPSSPISENAKANDLEELKKVISLANIKESYWVMWWAGYHRNVEMIEMCVYDSVDGSYLIADALAGLMNARITESRETLSETDEEFVTKVLWMHKDSLQKSGYIYKILPAQLDLLKQDQILCDFISTFAFDPKLKPKIKEFPDSSLSIESVEKSAGEMEANAKIFAGCMINDIEFVTNFIKQNKNRMKNDMLVIMWWGGFHCNRAMIELCLENGCYSVLQVFLGMSNNDIFDEQLATDILCFMGEMACMNEKNINICIHDLFPQDAIKEIKDECTRSENILYKFLAQFKYTGKKSPYSRYVSDAVGKLKAYTSQRK